ncbi:hypothetical protein [Streptomyces sp. NPDC051776]|uniref:hypothetical protein n=1 Tax=Streptomyces sp. NPDC051776 TaxID=3155414 RepID=UPI003427CA76
MNDTREVLTEDEVNDLLDGDRDAGWDTDDDHCRTTPRRRSRHRDRLAIRDENLQDPRQIF